MRRMLADTTASPHIPYYECGAAAATTPGMEAMISSVPFQQFMIATAIDITAGNKVSCEAFQL